MSGKIYTLDAIKAIAAPIAQNCGVAALYLFGSYAHGEAAPESDLDFRIEHVKQPLTHQIKKAIRKALWYSGTTEGGCVICPFLSAIEETVEKQPPNQFTKLYAMSTTFFWIPNL